MRKDFYTFDIILTQLSELELVSIISIGYIDKSYSIIKSLHKLYSGHISL